MEQPSQQAAGFVRRLADLTDRLAARDIVVSSLHADWSNFGCWALEARRGVDAMRHQELLDSPDPGRAVSSEVVRVFWDGRDRFVSLESSLAGLFSAPNQWKEECTRGFDSSGEDLLRFVEDYLVRRLAP